MLLSELYKLSRHIDQTPPMYGEWTIHWLIPITLEGQRDGDLIPLNGGKGVTRTVPVRKRSGINPPPFLLFDKAEYVLSLGRPQCHLAFKELVHQCALITQEAPVIAIDRFLQHWAPDQNKDFLPDKLNPGDYITFQVYQPDNRTVIPADAEAELLKVQQFWANYLEQEKLKKQPGSPVEGWCSVTGQYGLLTQREPIAIRGIPGGNSAGTSLVSANKNAFESFGLKNSFTSSISQIGSEGYLKALNYLIGSLQDSIRVGDSVYVWWVQQGAASDVDLNILDKPYEPDNLDRIQNLLESPITSQKTNEEDNELLTQHFFAIALTANNARAVIRSWIDVTIESVNHNLKIWFQGQKIDSLYEEDREFFGLYELAACAYREPKDMLSRTPTALFLAAIEGRPLPADLLDRLLRRIRVEGGSITHTRAALLKLILTLEGKINMNDPQNAMESLTRNPQFQDEQLGDRLAYHAGRLLAQVDRIQYAALGKVNAPIADRYYGSMSISPCYLLGKIIGKAQANLSKLRKEKPGQHNRFQEELEEILSKIPDRDLPNLPSRLSMQQQAIFAIGYYHQQAHNRQQIRDRAANFA